MMTYAEKDFPVDKDNQTDNLTPKDHNGNSHATDHMVITDIPLPQTDDNQRILARQTPSGVSRGVQQLGGPSLVADSGRKQIIVNDGDNRVLMGNQPTFGEGFYVSKPGIDVTTATDSADFTYNSNQNAFKIIIEGDATFTIPADRVSSLIIPHNLGFAPLSQVFLNQVDVGNVANDINIPLPTWLSANIDNVTTHTVTFGSWVFASTDTVNLYITCLNASGGSLGDIPVKYFILQESAGTTD